MGLWHAYLSWRRTLKTVLPGELIAAHHAVLDERRKERIESQWQESSIANSRRFALLEANQGKKPRLTARLHGTRFEHILEFSFKLAFPPSALPCAPQVPCRTPRDPFWRVRVPGRAPLPLP